MKWRVIIEQEQIGGAWKRVFDKYAEVSIHEVAARKIERMIKEEGLNIDRGELRDILAEELGEVR